MSGPCDGQRIDGIGLAVGASGVTDVGHQLWWHPHDRLACSEKVAFEPPRQMPAVFDCPEQTVALGQLLGPGQQSQMVFCGRGDRLRCQLATVGIDRDDGVGALVRIDSQSDH
ncbi:hypothetical protein A5N83_02090 [Rhodococcus sp. 1139]|nr:hypothetical protein A5N83_02090 [Rhodococcus sp. 1139]